MLQKCNMRRILFIRRSFNRNGDAASQNGWPSLLQSMQWRRAKLYGGTHRKEKKAGQKKMWSRVAGTQRASMLAGSWRYICASKELCKKGIFSSFSSFLTERAFIMLTLFSEILPEECIWNYPVNFVLSCQHILFELHAWTCPFLHITPSVFFPFSCNPAAAWWQKQK